MVVTVRIVSLNQPSAYPAIARAANLTRIMPPQGSVAALRSLLFFEDAMNANPQFINATAEVDAGATQPFAKSR